MTFPGKLEEWYGYEMCVDGGRRFVLPKKVADGKPWIWRARFFGHEPQFDIAMLERGFHVVYCDVADLYGSPEAVKRWDAFYAYLRFEHLFSDRVVLEGMSRGGLIVYNWAAANPDKVACIYADNPVCDFKSWPGGKGTGPGSPVDWQRCLNAYGLTDEEAMAYPGNPVDNLAPLVRAGIPIIHVIGDADEVVPVAENSDLVESRYLALGGKIEVIRKPGGLHHPHSLKDPTPLVDFVVRHTTPLDAISAEDIVGDGNVTMRSDFRNCRLVFEGKKRGHVAFLGGSITEMKGYRPKVCAMLTARFPDTAFSFTRAGISSTCSDTGAFRLSQDVLSQGPLDMLFVEFAVNDDQDSAQGFHDAQRGMEGIIAQARRHNPNVEIVMTHFVNERMLAKLQAGNVPQSIAAHHAVAARYSVSEINLAKELADLITAGKTDWKTYGGVHPHDYGNTMCSTMIGKALLAAWAQPLPEHAAAVPYSEVSPLDPFSYVNGRFLPVDDVQRDGNWRTGVPDWPKENEGTVRERFTDTPMVYSSTPHASLSVAFTGTAIGAYILSGPDAGIVSCSVDGGDAIAIDTLHHHSNFNYPMTVMFFRELPAGKHTLNLTILDNRPGRIKPGGTAFRAIAFAAN